MDNLKPFDPSEIDETTSRVVTHGDATYLMFPYVNAVGSVPNFDSVSCVIKGPAATVKDFEALSALAAAAGKSASWAISFNTPWLLAAGEAIDRAQRHGRSRR